MESKTYTQKEISTAINILENRLEDKKLERKSINAEIRDIKKNIDYYRDLDCSQIKMF